MIQSCLHCFGAVYARGLCCKHYKRFYKLIKRLKTTWAELEEEKKCLPSIPVRSRSPRGYEKSEIELLYRGDMEKVERHLAGLRKYYEEKLCLNKQ
jgi:hypothetical protein